MKSFSDWFSEVGPKKEEAFLPDNVRRKDDGSYEAVCCSCNEWSPFYGEEEELIGPEDIQHWCGGSPRCCPNYFAKALINAALLSAQS